MKEEIEAGDLVRVVTMDSREPYWPGLERYLGEDGLACESECGCIRVEFSNGVQLWFLQEWLDIMEPKDAREKRLKQESEDLIEAAEEDMKTYDRAFECYDLCKELYDKPGANFIFATHLGPGLNEIFNKD